MNQLIKAQHQTRRDAALMTNQAACRALAAIEETKRLWARFVGIGMAFRWNIFW